MMDDAILVGTFLALGAACAACLLAAYRQHRRGHAVA
jgi:hypothetical protein